MTVQGSARPATRRVSIVHGGNFARQKPSHGIKRSRAKMGEGSDKEAVASGVAKASENARRKPQRKKPLSDK